MAIAFVAASAVVTGADPTVAIPAGYAEGNLLVLVTTGTATPTTPTGWTQRYAQGAGRFVTVLTKYAGSTEASVALTLAGTTSKSVMLCYSGAGSYDVVGTVATGTSTSAATVSQTTTYANDFVISIFARTTTASTFTVPASTTSRVNSSSSTSINGLLLVDELQAAAGASAVRTSTLSVSGAWAAINISFVETRTLYWVGGTGTWDTSTTGNWANTSGGSGTGIRPPVENEIATIDTSSGTGTITCTGGVCGNLSVTASQAIILGAAGSTLTVDGTLSFPAGGSFSANTNLNTITLGAGSAKTVTTNGKSFSSLTFDGVGGNWTLPSALTATGTVTLTNGTLTLSTNNTTLSCNAFLSNNANTRAIAFGTTGNITTTGAGNAFDMSTVTNFTRTGTTRVNISNNSAVATTLVSHVTGGSTGNSLNFNITTGTYALTITTASRVNALNFTGFTGSWSPGVSTYTFDGSITLVAGMTFTAGTGVWSLLNTGTYTITTAGFTINPITQNASNTVTFPAGTTTVNGTYTFTQGTLALDTNASSLSCTAFSSNNSNTRAIQFGTGSITTTGSGTAWTTGTATNLTYTGTPTVNISNNSSVATTVTAHTVGGTEANAFDFNFTTGTYTLTLTTTSVIKSLNFTGFAGFYTQTVLTIYGNFTVSSGMTYTSSGSKITFAATSGVQLLTSAGKTLGQMQQSGAGGTVRLAAGTTTISATRDYSLERGTLDLGTNSATFSCGQFNVDGSNTRSIIFGTGNITTTGSNTTAWNSQDATNLTYTGTPTVNITTASGTVTIDAHATGATESNVVNININSTVLATIDIANNSKFKSLNFTGYSGTWSPTFITCSFYGNITLAPLMTFTTGSGGWNLLATSGTQSITSAGKTLNSITQNGVGGTVSLVDALSSLTYTLTNGTFDANDQNLTLSTGFVSSNSNIRTINMGSGVWTLSGTGSVWNITTTNLTFNADTSTIELSDASTTAKTFDGAGRTYYNFILGGLTGIATYTITGANTFNSIVSSKSVSSTLVLPASTTTTTATFGVNGSGAGKLFNITSSTSGTQATLNVTNPFTLDYVIVQDNNLSSTNGTVNNSGLSSNTTGWTVGTGSSYFALLSSTIGGTFTVPSNWDSTNNTIHIIGGGGGAARGSTAGSNRAGGGGGGGGGYIKLSNLSYSSGNVVGYIAGTGGGAAATASPSTGSTGGTTYWNASLSTVTFYSSTLSRQTTAATTITVTRPAGVNGDELMIMIVNSGTIGNTWTTPSGWTAGSNNASARAVFYKTAGASEPGSYTVTQSGSSTSDGTILVYTNAQWGGDGANTANASTVTPTTTVTYNNSTVIFCGFDNSASLTFSTPTGYTSRQADTDATTPSQTVFDISGISGGSYTAPTSTITGGGATGRAFLVVVSPTVGTFSSYAYATGGTGGASTTTPTSTGGAGGTGHYFPEYVASAKTQLTSSATTITINVPTGTANGDLLIAVLTAAGAGSTTWTTPSGWTVGITASQGKTVFYKTASSEPASYTFTASGSDTHQGYILTYRNAQFGVGGTVSTSASSPAVAPAITTTAANAIIFDVVSQTGTSITYSTPTGYASLNSDSDATAPSSNIFITTQAVAGSTGTVSSNPSSGSARAYLFAIYPVITTQITYTGGTGGVGATTTTLNNATGGGGGGGAAGPNGNGANGGSGFSTANNSTSAGGGGGGNGGGSTGGNASTSTGGAGGNNSAGIGGGIYTNSSTPGNGSLGGGGAGMANNNTQAGSGSNGIELVNLYGSGGGSGGSININSVAVAGLYGGGGGGSGVSTGGGTASADDGSQGAIIVLWRTVAPAPPSSGANNMFLMFL
jgi:hypothetical protein